jgi:hypothetical protein
MDSNQLKSINGYNAKCALLQQLQELHSQGVISYCTSDYRNGYKELDSDQFFAPFYIEFPNGVGWLIFASTSVRNDRMNNQQWNSYHLKKLAPNIRHSYLVVPDEIISNKKELMFAKAYNNKIFDNKMYSTIDVVLTQSQLVKSIINYHKRLTKAYSNEDGYKNASEPVVTYGLSISDFD